MICFFSIALLNSTEAPKYKNNIRERSRSFFLEEHTSYILTIEITPHKPQGAHAESEDRRKTRTRKLVQVLSSEGHGFWEMNS